MDQNEFFKNDMENFYKNKFSGTDDNKFKEKALQYGDFSRVRNASKSFSVAVYSF